MRKSWAEWYLGVWDDENRERWTLRYAEELSLRLGGTLFSWETWKVVYSDLEGTKEWDDAEHSHRRTIAILDEEIDLHKQSSFLAEGARHLNKTVSSGCWYVLHSFPSYSKTNTLWPSSVNKAEFRRRYGF